MHPSLALSLVLLSWCYFRNRTMGSRALLAAALALLGWEPATAGNLVGVALILIAVGAALSIVWDMASEELSQRRAARAFADGSFAGVAPAAAGAPAAP